MSKASVSPINHQVRLPGKFSGTKTHDRRRLCSVRVKAAANTGEEAEKQQQKDKKLTTSSGGTVVDGNMVTLRNRIKEIKAIEKGGEVMKEDWMGFDKEYCCKLYDSELIETLALFQLYKEVGQPRIAVGMTVMIAITVPTSVIVGMLHFVDVANWIINGVPPLK